MEPDYKKLYFELLDKEIERWQNMHSRCKRITSGNAAHDAGAAAGISNGWVTLLNREKEKNNAA